MARLIWLILVLMLCTSPLVAAAKPGEGNAGELTIRSDGHMLTLKAKQVPHRRILEGLARELNFELIMAGALEERRSIEIEARPWEEALKRVLSPASWAFVYRATDGQPQLAKVYVFPTKESGAATARTPANFERVATPMPVPTRPAPLQAGELPRQGEQGLDTTLTELLSSEDEESRALALVGLASMGGEAAIAALTQALQDKEPWIRETAIEGLAEIGGEQAIQGLQQALRDENVEVRKAAQEALSRLRQSPQ
jgi:hypothetical protein